MNQYVVVDEEDIGALLPEAPPAALVLGYARFAAPGKEPLIHRVSAREEILGWMVSASGNPEALPGRMYGFLVALGGGRVDLDVLYKDVRREFGGNWRVHLPPQQLGPKYEASFKGKLSRYESHTTFLVKGRTPEEYWSRLKRVGRQGVAKAERLGVVVKEGFAGAAMMQFLALHVAKNARLGSPSLNREMIGRLQQVFGDALFLFVGYHEGRAVSAVLGVCCESYGMLIDNASNPDDWGTNPNNLVVWKAMEHFSNLGARVVDMGFSGPGEEGASQFKEHMGGESAPCFTVGAR